MKSHTDYWKNWWNEQAGRSGSDYSLNRQTSVRLTELERSSEIQFMGAVAPAKTDEILDAGCGSGRNLSLLSPLVKRVVGIDYSEQMILRAREMVQREGITNAQLETGDITKLQFRDAAFDKVICASVLQYLNDEECAQALAELCRVTKRGGRLILHVKNGTSLYGLSLKVIRPIARLFGKKMKPEFYRSRAWHERTLAAQGGRVIESDGFGILTFVPLPAAVVRLLLGFELRFLTARFLKRYAVNYKLTLTVDSHQKS